MLIYPQPCAQFNWIKYLHGMLLQRSFLNLRKCRVPIYPKALPLELPRHLRQGFLWLVLPFIMIFTCVSQSYSWVWTETYNWHVIFMHSRKQQCCFGTSHHNSGQKLRLTMMCSHSHPATTEKFWMYFCLSSKC